MFDPNLGRWMQNDPIGFAGGDEDLYRFVENNPINLVDPTGLKEKPPFPDKPGTITDPIENTGAPRTGDGRVISGGKGKSGYPDNTIAPPPVKKEDLPALGAPGSGVISGTHKFCTLPGEGKFFGTGGCETCVGLIVVCDGGKGAIFHFTTDDKAQSTLAKYDWSNERGCKAYIFGGNDERGSKNLFDEVFNWSSRLFGKKNVFVIDASAAYVNSKGEIVVRPPAK